MEFSCRSVFDFQRHPELNSYVYSPRAPDESEEAFSRATPSGCGYKGAALARCCANLQR